MLFRQIFPHDFDNFINKTEIEVHFNAIWIIQCTVKLIFTLAANVFSFKEHISNYSKWCTKLPYHFD